MCAIEDDQRLDAEISKIECEERLVSMRSKIIES